MIHVDYPRFSIVALKGAVATSQPLAAQAGLQILQAGGNAVDAAVAAAATLNVVEPMSTGIGGDMFCLIWLAKQKRVIALNGSGRAPAAADAQSLHHKGYQVMPLDGKEVACSITVPGTVAGWQTALESYGQMTLKEVLKPAIEYAQQGFIVSQFLAQTWQLNEAKLAVHPSGQEFLLNGHAPRYGDLISLPTLAKTLEIISEGGKAAFYQGELADKIATFVQAQGGWLTKADLAAHTSTWDEPISTNYRDVTVWECPPNGQGLAALLALNIVENFDLRTMGPQSIDRYHVLIEAMRLSFADTLHYVTDPCVLPVPVSALLSKKYAKQRSHLINPQQALPFINYGQPVNASDTVYISVVDGEGNACSLINSLYYPFGSNLVVPGTGIVLQNRGANFSLNSEHPNYLQPNKRPYHTIMPAMATRNGELWLCFGVVGGFQQPQGHLQVISNLVDFEMDVQQALNALRFRVDLETGIIKLEAGVSTDIVAGLKKRQHQVQLIDGFARVNLGGGQIIARQPENGALYVGSEPRQAGAAVGY